MISRECLKNGIHKMLAIAKIIEMVYDGELHSANGEIEMKRVENGFKKQHTREPSNYLYVFIVR